MDYSAYETIAAARDGRKLTLSIDRPKALNAVNGKLHKELSTIFTDAQRDDDVDVVVLSGTGKAFCAGGDIGWMQDILATSGGMTSIAVEGKTIVRSMLDLEKPLIGRINGDAIGLGATLALFCDVIVMNEEARIADPHVKVGLVAGDGSAIIWPQLIGHARAKEFLMTGDMMTGRRAAEIGLVNYAVPMTELDELVDKIAGKLLRGPQAAIRWSKVSVNIGLKQLADSILDASIGYEVASSLLPDHAEGVAAFAEGRKPDFGKSRA